MTERITVINARSEEESYQNLSNVVIIAYIDYDKDKRLYRSGTKLISYDNKTLYPKILGTVTYPETVSSFMKENRDLILKYEIVLLEIYQKPMTVSFDKIRTDGII